MSEQHCRFGTNGRLCGMVHEPETRRRPFDTPVVIFISAGLIHKSGPFRLYVDLARTLAARGIPSLRFDLSGIGESRPHEGGESAEQAAITDVEQAMDTLEREVGARRFILAGLCSGAEVAHRVALKDERVCGLIALDGYIVRTAAYYWWHYLPRVFSLQKWFGFVSNRLSRFMRRIVRRNAISEEDDDLSFWGGPGPGKAQLAEEFDSISSRGVRQLQIFSGGSGDCSYEGQFRDAFSDVDFRGLLEVHFLRDSDHVYVLRADRHQLISVIEGWTLDHFAATARSGDRPSALASPRAVRDRNAFPSGVSGPSAAMKFAERRNAE